jgi:nicotinate phosphoribosyltransferase
VDLCNHCAEPMRSRRFSDDSRAALCTPLATGIIMARVYQGALFTDLYEVAMTGTAVFETMFRELPPQRGFVIAAGVLDIIDFLEAFRFEPDDVGYLRGLGMFSDELLDALPAIRFTGDVWAMPEGTLAFPHEPIVQVIAPIIEAQLVETFVLNQTHFHSVIASKAARIVRAAEGRAVVDFGSRHAHGAEAAVKWARAAYLAGVAGTSNVLAAQMYGIPAFGTMAHSFIQALVDESTAFEAYARQFPTTTLLVDTYDTLDGVDRVIALARRLGSRFAIRGVRLDSGDLGALAFATRAKLDAAGLRQVQIFASSGLDERRIAELVAAHCPIDGFGVGTELTIAPDAPSLDMAYKLVEYAGAPRTKLSKGKVIYPGRKQVFRRHDHDVMAGDTIGRFDERLPGDPLLVPVMLGGRRLSGELDLASARRRVERGLAALAPGALAVERPRRDYPVVISERVAREFGELRRALKA